MSSSPVRPGTPPVTATMASVFEAPVTGARVLTNSPEHQIARAIPTLTASNKEYCSTKGWASVSQMLKDWTPPEEEEVQEHDSLLQEAAGQSLEAPAAVEESPVAATQTNANANVDEGTTALHALNQYGEENLFAEETLPSQSNQLEAEAVAEEGVDGEGDVSGEESEGVQTRGSDRSQSGSEAESSDEELKQIAKKSKDNPSSDPAESGSDKRVASSPVKDAAGEPNQEPVITKEAAQQDPSLTATNSRSDQGSSAPMELEDLSDTTEVAQEAPSTSKTNSSQPVSGRISPWLQNWREEHGYPDLSSFTSSSSSTLSTPSRSLPSTRSASHQPLPLGKAVAASASDDANKGLGDLSESEEDRILSNSSSSSLASESSPATTATTDPKLFASATSLSSTELPKPNKKRDCISSLKGACASLDPRNCLSKKEKPVSKEENAASSKLEATSSVTRRNFWPSVSLPQVFKRSSVVSSSTSSTAASAKEIAPKERKKPTCHRNDAVMMTMALVVLGVVANHFIKR